METLTHRARNERIIRKDLNNENRRGLQNEEQWYEQIKWHWSARKENIIGAQPSETHYTITIIKCANTGR